MKMFKHTCININFNEKQTKGVIIIDCSRGEGGNSMNSIPCLLPIKLCSLAALVVCYQAQKLVKIVMLSDAVWCIFFSKLPQINTNLTCWTCSALKWSLRVDFLKVFDHSLATGLGTEYKWFLVTSVKEIDNNHDSSRAQLFKIRVHEIFFWAWKMWT